MLISSEFCLRNEAHIPNSSIYEIKTGTILSYIKRQPDSFPLFNKPADLGYLFNFIFATALKNLSYTLSRLFRSPLFNPGHLKSMQCW